METMLGLVKNLTIKFFCRYNTSAVTMLEKIKPSKESVIRKVWGLTSNIQPQVHLDKMGASSASFLPYSTGYGPCSMAANLLLIYEAVSGHKLQTLLCFLRIILSLPIGPYANFNNFWEGTTKCLNFDAKIW